MTTSTFVFADDDLHIRREITVQSSSEKEAHTASWAMLTNEEKDACGCWTCIDSFESKPSPDAPQDLHTGGTWFYDEENDGGIYSVNHTYIGAAVNLGTTEGSANATLMAASPELLIALRKLVALAQSHGVPAKDIAFANAAIAKAKYK